MYELFKNQAVDGNSDAVQLVEAGVDRVWTVQVTGTPGGGTVQIQLAPDPDGPWAPLDGASFTAAGAKTFECSRMWYVRANLGGATGPDLTVGIQ